MKILVTGGVGFIGSFLADELIEKGHEVVLYDNLDPQVHLNGKIPSYYNPKAKFICGDVRDYEKFRDVLLDGVQVVFHFAAAVGITQSQYRIKHYCDVNQGGTTNLLDILANHKHRVRKIIVAASMSSYGEGVCRCERDGEVRPPVRSPEQMERGDWNLYCLLCHSRVETIPTREDAALNCNSIYSINKMNQEQSVLNFGRTYDLPAIALRFFNVYGPRQSLSNPYTGVSAIFMSRIKNNKSPILYEDGLQTRDFVSVHDVVKANILALEKDEGNYHVFNVGSGMPTTIRSVAEKLAEALGVDISPVVSDKFRKGDVRHCCADMTKAKNLLGFYPSVSFDDGLKELVEWSKGEIAADLFHEAEREMVERGLAGHEE